MADEPSDQQRPDIWEEFLRVRVHVIEWLHSEVQLKDPEIVKAINLNVTQVFMLRTGAASTGVNEGGVGKTQAAPLSEGGEGLRDAR